MSYTNRLEEAVRQAESASEIARQWANGPENTTVATESGSLPTIAEFMRLKGNEIDETVANLTQAINGLSDTVKYGDVYWDKVFSPLAAADIPTVSVSTTQQTTGTLITPSGSFFSDPNFRFDGCVGLQIPAVGYVWASTSPSGVNYYCNPEFVTAENNSVFECRVYAPSAGLNIGVRILVDGKLSSMQLQRFSATPSTVHYIRVQFPTARSRRIVVEIDQISQFGGVIVPAGQSIKRPSREWQRGITVVADSFGRGAGYATGGSSGLETFSYYLCRLLGADRIVNLAIGGTGWTNPGPNDVFGTRISEIQSAGNQACIIVGSRNDNNRSGIFGAVDNMLSQLYSVPYIAVGGPAQPAFSAVNDQVKFGASVNSREFVDVLDVITPALTWTDGVHPSYEGHLALAKSFYDRMDHQSCLMAIESAQAARENIEITLTAAPSSPQPSGTSITFSASISPNRSGVIVFMVDGVENSRFNTSTSASFNISSLSVGSHIVTANFYPENQSKVKRASKDITFVVQENLGFTDDFNRANGPVGNTLNGKPWQFLGTGGAWVISSNALINSTITSGNHYAVVDAGSPNCDFSIALGGTVVNAAFIVFRAQNQTNLLRLAVQSSQIVLQQVVANVTTTLATGSVGSWVAGDVIKVKCNGSSITVQRNGVDVPGLTSVIVSQFSTETKFGVGSNTSAAGVTYDSAICVAV